MSETAPHQPVLLAEVVAGLALEPGETVLDATVNRGGHAGALCQALGAAGRLIGLDADRAALAEAGSRLKLCPCPVTLVEGNFRDLAALLERSGITSINAILFDLGWSREQLEESGRGFSFSRAEPLLMTFQLPTAGEVSVTAADIVNDTPEERLADLIYHFGQERFSRQIAEAIVKARRQAPVKTTTALVEVIRSAVPRWYQHGRRHFATKTFQALRMATNDELGALAQGLGAAWTVLAPGGRLAVISFHSLEARAVKDFFRTQVKLGLAELLTKKAIRPSRAEIKANPRSRSATLRILKKI